MKLPKFRYDCLRTTAVTPFKAVVPPGNRWRPSPGMTMTGSRPACFLPRWSVARTRCVTLLTPWSWLILATIMVQLDATDHPLLDIWTKVAVDKVR